MSEKTRILVTGLPPYLTEKRLKEVFSRRKEIITDCKLIVNSTYVPTYFFFFSFNAFYLFIYFRTKVSRRFAFIGFYKQKDAEDAIAFHNNTYIDTFKIRVEWALPV